jgi:hypothetical protein
MRMCVEVRFQSPDIARAFGAAAHNDECAASVTAAVCVTALATYAFRVRDGYIGTKELCQAQVESQPSRLMPDV